MTTYTRADWGARPAKAGPGQLDPKHVVGLAFHWPAMSKPLATVDAVKRALRGWQAYHMDDRGWSDIAYQVAVDQAGNRYELRGLRTQSAANGDTDVNETYGAVLLILAPGEKPTAAMVATVRDIVAEHRRIFPNSRRLVGHGQIRPEPTACPGPAAQAAIDAGTFEPPVPSAPTRVEQAREQLHKARVKIRRAAALLDETPASRTVAHQGADTARQVARDLGALLERLPQR